MIDIDAARELADLAKGLIDAGPYMRERAAATLMNAAVLLFASEDFPDAAVVATGSARCRIGDVCPCKMSLNEAEPYHHPDLGRIISIADLTPVWLVAAGLGDS